MTQEIQPVPCEVRVRYRGVMLVPGSDWWNLYFTEQYDKLTRLIYQAEEERDAAEATN